jgi:hypothetical protein
MCRLASAAEVALTFIDFQCPAFRQTPANSSTICDRSSKKKGLSHFLRPIQTELSSVQTKDPCQLFGHIMHAAYVSTSLSHYP